MTSYKTLPGAFIPPWPLSTHLRRYGITVGATGFSLFSMWRSVSLNSGLPSNIQGEAVDIPGAKPKQLSCMVCSKPAEQEYGRYEKGCTCSASCDLILRFCNVCGGPWPSHWVETPEGVRRMHRDCTAKWHKQHPKGYDDDPGL